MKLYNYYRSSASYRVRIALGLKGLRYDYVAVNLLRSEQLAPDFAARTAAQAVPLLEDGDALVGQSLAIIEYLDETHPEPPLLPGDALARARIRALAQDIACEIHPLNNLRVLRYLVRDLGVGEDAKNAWYRHWVEDGLASLEARVVAEGLAGRHVLGDRVTLADVVLVPQIFNARRFDCRLDHVPTLMGIFDRCMELAPFVDAQPSRQPDAE